MIKDVVLGVMDEYMDGSIIIISPGASCRSLDEGTKFIDAGTLIDVDRDIIRLLQIEIRFMRCGERIV